MILPPLFGVSDPEMHWGIITLLVENKRTQGDYLKYKYEFRKRTESSR